MKRMDWVVGACLSLLLIGGLAVDVNAQQPPAPAAPAESKPQAPDSSAQPAAPQGEPRSQAQPQQSPSTNTQIETRTEKSERIVEREPGKFLGVDPTVAMIVGAVPLLVIVISVVAMSRRGDEVHHRDDRHRV